MSDTPRVDSYVYKFPGCQREPRLIDFARQLEKELAEAQTEVERLALEIENQQYTITCASEENQQLKESLAEARAEINIIEHDANVLLGDIKAELERKDKLIEQMTDALKWALSEARTTECERMIEAALSAAERGGK